MTELIEQIQRYAEAVDGPAAVGPDPSEPLDHDHHRFGGGAGRLALVACLLVLVVVAGGMLIATRRTEAPAPIADHSVTVTESGEELAVSLTVDDPSVDYGGTLTVRAVLTNTSTEPLSVVVSPWHVLTITWGANPTSNSARLPTLEQVAVPYSATSLNPPPAEAADTPGDLFDPRARVMLEPGESVTIDGVRRVDETVRTGSVLVSMRPSVVEVVDGREQIRPVEGGRVSVPVTVGTPATGGLTLPDAVAAALADPEIVSWGAVADAKGGVAGAFAGNVERHGDGWRFLYGATDGNAGPDLEAELRQMGGPGFVVTVDGDGTATVDWIAMP